MTTRSLVTRAAGLYLATRAFSAVLLLIAAAQQGPNPWTDDAPSYAEITGLWWDAGWYERIAETGYPMPVPLGQQSAWAFFPLYPLLVRAGMAITTAPFIVVAPTLSLIAGTAAAGVLAVLVRDQAIGRDLAAPAAANRALAVVLLLGLFPAAPVLQAAYSEALALLFLVLALWLTARHRYLLAAAAVIALGLTRPVALPFALVVAWHAWQRHRSNAPPTRRQWWGIAALGAASIVGGFAWPVITGIAAGRIDAYLTVQEAWRSGGEVAPVLAWFSFATEHLGSAGIVVVAAAIGLGALAVLAPPARTMGTEVRAWTAGYLAWLLVAVQPHSSTIRQLILALGVPIVLIGSSRIRLALLATVSAAAQVAWVMVLWRLGMAPSWPP